MRIIIILFLILFFITPNYAFGVSKSDYPGALQGTIEFLGDNGSDFQANVTIPTYELDCWNDIGFTATLYNEYTGEAVASVVNSTSRHICGYKWYT